MVPSLNSSAQESAFGGDRYVGARRVLFGQYYSGPRHARLAAASFAILPKLGDPSPVGVGYAAIVAAAREPPLEPRRLRRRNLAALRAGCTVEQTGVERRQGIVQLGEFRGMADRHL